MAYTSRHTGKEIDDAVDIVIQGGGGSSITVDTSLSTTSNNPIANSTVTKALNGKQPTISVTTKPNGNIVMLGKEFMPATPSGDTQHYAYVAAGAVWNVNAEKWSYLANLGGLTDLTTADMRKIYFYGWNYSSALPTGLWHGDTSGRITINKCGWTNAYEINNIVVNNNAVEIAVVRESSAMFQIKTLVNSFRNCSTLKRVIGKMDMTYCTSVSNNFKNVPNLEYVDIVNIKQNIDISGAPKLSEESLLYMIHNCASEVSFTITLHPDVYEKCQEFGEWFEGIESALTGATDDKNTSITFILNLEKSFDM